MVMWQDLNGGRCSMGDACSNPPDSDGVFKMLMKNFDRHYSTNRWVNKFVNGFTHFDNTFKIDRAPFGLFYHAAWFTQVHHKEGFIKFLDHINAMNDVWLVTNWQALQFVRDPTPISRINQFQPFQCDFSVSCVITIFLKNYLNDDLTFDFSYRIVQRNAITQRCVICGTNQAYDTCERVNRAPKSTRGLAKLASDRLASTMTLKSKVKTNLA